MQINKNEFNIDLSNYPDLPSDYLLRNPFYRYLCQIVFNININYEYKRQLALELNKEYSDKTFRKIAYIVNKKSSGKFTNIENNKIKNVIPYTKTLNIIYFK